MKEKDPSILIKQNNIEIISLEKATNLFGTEEENYIKEAVNLFLETEDLNLENSTLNSLQTTSQKNTFYNYLVFALLKTKTPDQIPKQYTKIETFFDYIIPLTIEYKVAINSEIIKQNPIVVSNHPILDRSLNLDLSYFNLFKNNENVCNYSFFHTPFIRDMIYQKALKQIGINTLKPIIRNIGFENILEQLGYIILPQNQNKGTDFLINQINEKNFSVLLFPEGGFKLLEHDFRTGFYYIAKQTKRPVVVCAINEYISLNSPNYIKVIDCLDNDYINHNDPKTITSHIIKKIVASKIPNANI